MDVYLLADRNKICMDSYEFPNFFEDPEGVPLK